MYPQHDSNAAAEQQQYQLSQTQFSPSLYGLDPRLQGSPKGLSSAARSLTGNQLTSTQHPSTDNHGRLPLSASGSPHMSARSTPQGSKTTWFKPTDRSLPSMDVTAETITEAFTMFILYCNPNFPLDVDTSTLRTNFQSPPKSDNKDFETFRLFELIKKFDSKEIKTWAQLALDLGVEAPDPSKGQSVQKVQQYSVRLKRWMHATHIDAFFEYLLGKQHSYFLEVPYPTDPYPAGGRDGVSAEEDLAIRALDPSFRPKRGRRRNSETEHDESGSVSKQPRLLEGAPRSSIPLSAMPMSAHPDAFHDLWDAASAIKPGGVAPWNRSPRMPQSAAPPSNPNSLRWPLDTQTQTPASPFAMSALPSALSSHIDADFDGEPRSAITPSTRKRRKHGPAVSSAWPSTNAPGSKPRGRPPANRNIQDGPFGTFPADPTNDTSGNRNMTPISGSAERSISQETVAALPTEIPMFRSPAGGTGRPGRLSLQVPSRTSAPVRLATPPRVLVNDEINERSSSDAVSAVVDGTSSTNPHSRATPVIIPAPGGGHFRSVGDLHMHVPDRKIPGFAYEVLRRVLASDLLRAVLVGRRQRLTGDEAKRLADAVLDRIGIPHNDTDSSRDDIARLTAASWLGIGDQLNVPLGPAIGRGKRITATRFRTNPDGYEEISYGDEHDNDSTSTADDGTIREVFDISWTVALGSCLGSFELKGLELVRGGPNPVPGEDLHDLLLRKTLEAAQNIDRDGWVEQGMHEVARSAARSRSGEDLEDENIDWKARCKAMEFAGRLAKGEMDRFKNRILERILDSAM